MFHVRCARRKAKRIRPPRNRTSQSEPYVSFAELSTNCIGRSLRGGAHEAHRDVRELPTFVRAWRLHGARRSERTRCGRDRGILFTMRAEESMTFGSTVAEKVAQRILEREGAVVTPIKEEAPSMVAALWRALVCPLKTKTGWFTRRGDLWGAIDLAVMHRAHGFRFIQVCTTDGVTKHRRKIELLPWPTFEKEADRESSVALFQRDSYSVELWEAREGRNVLSATKLTRGFRVHVYDPVARVWTVTATITVPDDIEV